MAERARTDERAAGTRSAPACPACGGPGVDRGYQVESYDLYRCDLCSTEFLVQNPDRPVTDTTYWDQYKFDIYANAAVQAEYSHRYAAVFDAIDEGFGPPSSVLDVGCGIGNFLMWAGERGLRAVGSDAEQDAVDSARERGLEVWNSAELADNLEPGSIDVLTLWDVIEHVTDPRDFLQEQIRYVKPGGLVVIETPDSEFFMRPIVIGVRKVAEPIRWSDMLYYKAHVTYFSGRGLSTLMARCGLDVVLQTDMRSPSAKMAKIFDVFADAGSGAGRLGPAMYKGLDRTMRLMGMTNKLVMVGRVPTEGA